jgi:hypothetical protein
MAENLQAEKESERSQARPPQPAPASKKVVYVAAIANLAIATCKSSRPPLPEAPP